MLGLQVSISRLLQGMELTEREVRLVNRNGLW